MSCIEDDNVVNMAFDLSLKGRIKGEGCRECSEDEVVVKTVFQLIREE